MVCFKCGYENNNDSLFCEKCGTKLDLVEEKDNNDTVFCPNCGAENLSNVLFCDKCGFKMTNEEEGNTEINTNASSFSVSQRKTKKSKKMVVFGIVVLVIALAACLYFGKDYIFKESSLDVDWGNTYYLYLKDAIKNDTLEEIGLSEDINNSKIDFIEVEDIEEPVMVITYEKEEDDYVNFYYISDEEVELSSSNKGDVKLLYEIETEEYNYYLHTEEDSDEKIDSYTLTEYIIKKRDESVEKIFKESDVTTVSSNDEEVILTKFDETFIEIDVDTSKDFSLDSDIKEIKEIINTSSNDYQTLDEVVTDEVKITVEEKVTEVEETKEKIKEIEEENEKNEKMEITSSNFKTKLGTQITWFAKAYIDYGYGWAENYEITEVTDKSITHADEVKSQCSPDISGLYKLNGVTSLSSLKTELSKYILSSKISEFTFKDLVEYKNQVYWCSEPVGDTSVFDVDDASLVSYSDGVAKVRIWVDNTNETMSSVDITLTFKYQEDSDTYIITDWVDKYT